MYFAKFPYMVYTLDNYSSGQIVKDIFRRVIALTEFKENYTMFDEYDVKDGETPEILADKIYGNSNLHWIILLTNDILDPRYEWPLSNYNLIEYVRNKYHRIVSKKISLSSNIVSSTDADVKDFIRTLSVNDLVEISGSVNTVNNDTFKVTAISALKDNFTVSDEVGGAITFTSETNNTYITLFSDHTQATHHYEDSYGNIVYSNGSSISNFTYEERLNEDKRRIKILKPQFVSSVEQELEIALRP